MSHFEYLEGRRYAIEVLESVNTGNSRRFIQSDINTIVDNLQNTAAKHPKGYAQGIQSIVMQVREAQCHG